MKIGITEYGDAGIDFRWEQKLTELNGAVLITKNLTDTFIQKVILHSENFPIIVHCTCTGWGGSMLEPNVPNFKTQLNQLQKLIKAGFPVERTVLRVDPIFPTEKGLQRIQEMFAYYHTLNLPEDKIRYRMNSVDSSFLTDDIVQYADESHTQAEEVAIVDDYWYQLERASDAGFVAYFPLQIVNFMKIYKI